MSSLEEDVVARACSGQRFYRKPFDEPHFLHTVAALATSARRDYLRIVK